MDKIVEQINLLKDFLLKDESYLFIKNHINNHVFIRSYFSMYNTLIIDDNMGALNRFKNYKYFKLSKKIDAEFLYNFYSSLNLHSDSNLDIQIQKAMLILHAYYRIISMSQPKEIEVSSYDKYWSLLQGSSSTKWYRGHADSSWELIPSLYRNILEPITQFNFDSIVQDLEEKKIVSKLSNIFDDSKINYRKLAFLQHSLGYSPFLDFSKSPEIGLSFALSNMDNVSQFFHKKASIYELDTSGIEQIKNESEADSIIRKVNITVLKGNPSIYRILKTEMWNQFIKGQLDSKIILIDIQTNDRMIYQKGVFLLFNNVLVIGNKMLLSLEKQQFLRDRMKKYIISEKNRLSIYETFLENQSKYQLRYLMNPYSHMQE